MVPKWKRVLLLLISFILAGILCCFLVSISHGLGDPPDPGGILGVFVFACLMVFIYGSPALVLALPIILFVTDFRAWRFWAFLALGAAIGPIALYLLLLSASPHYVPDKTFLLFTLPLSTVATLIYLLLFRRLQRAAKPRPPTS